MKISNPQKYELKFLDNGKYKVKGENEEEKFSAPASSKATPKLYVLYDSKIIHYVGITSQSMVTRLRQGFNANGLHGYHGYKWKNRVGGLGLSIWVLADIEPDKAYQELETIEAEIVFLCRLYSNQWPESQHEIHFHKSNKFHRKSAQQIYGHIELSLK